QPPFPFFCVNGAQPFIRALRIDDTRKAKCCDTKQNGDSYIVHYFARPTRPKNLVHLLESRQSFSKRGSLRSGSQSGLVRRSPMVAPLGSSSRCGNAAIADSVSPVCVSTIASAVSAKGFAKASLE